MGTLIWKKTLSVINFWKINFELICIILLFHSILSCSFYTWKYKFCIFLLTRILPFGELMKFDDDISPLEPPLLYLEKLQQSLLCQIHATYWPDNRPQSLLQRWTKNCLAKASRFFVQGLSLCFAAAVAVLQQECSRVAELGKGWN